MQIHLVSTFRFTQISFCLLLAPIDVLVIVLIQLTTIQHPCNTIYVDVAGPTSIPKRPIAYCLLNRVRTIRPNQIASHQIELLYAPCAPYRIPAHNTNRVRIPAPFECLPVSTVNLGRQQGESKSYPKRPQGQSL